MNIKCQIVAQRKFNLLHPTHVRICLTTNKEKLLLEGIKNYFGTFEHEATKLFLHFAMDSGGTLWRSWLKHCATNQKATGSISIGVTGIFY